MFMGLCPGPGTEWQSLDVRGVTACCEWPEGSSPIWEHGGGEDVGLHPSCHPPPTPCCVALEGVPCLSVLLEEVMVPSLRFHPADHSTIQTANGGAISEETLPTLRKAFGDPCRSQHLEALLQIIEETGRHSVNQPHECPSPGSLWTVRPRASHSPFLTRTMRSQTPTSWGCRAQVTSHPVFAWDRAVSQDTRHSGLKQGRPSKLG